MEGRQRLQRTASTGSASVTDEIKCVATKSSLIGGGIWHSKREREDTWMPVGRSSGFEQVQLDGSRLGWGAFQ